MGFVEGETLTQVLASQHSPTGRDTPCSVASGKGYFAAEEVEDLAFELMTSGGDRISIGLVRQKLEKHPETCRRALQLLRQMGFILIRRGPAGISLLRTLRWEELVEGAR